MPSTTVYFISETAPVNTHASSVVFYRHLQKLTQDGHHVVWVTDQNTYEANKEKAKQWDVIVLPNRRWHLPPYRGKGLAQYYRFAYYYRKYLKPVIEHGPAILLTHIHGQFLAPFAAFVKNRTKIPLISFFHDDILELNFYQNVRSLVKNTEKILEASSVVLTVSDAFKKNWPRYAPKFRLLYPLPEAYQAVSAPKKKPTFTIAYAGALYNELIPCFEQLLQYLQNTNYRLLIIGDLKKTNQLSKLYPETLTCMELFDTPAEALDFLVEHCNAAIIPYPTEISAMPWIATCYPSKFIQYCQLNLPTIIIAPIGSAIGKWCIDNKWQLYSTDYSPQSISKLLNILSDGNIKMQIDELNAGDFNPEKITSELEHILQHTLMQSKK